MVARLSRARSQAVPNDVFADQRAWTSIYINHIITIYITVSIYIYILSIYIYILSIYVYIIHIYIIYINHRSTLVVWIETIAIDGTMVWLNLLPAHVHPVTAMSLGGLSHNYPWSQCFSDQSKSLNPDFAWSNSTAGVSISNRSSWLTAHFWLKSQSGWWLGTFFIFLYIGNNHPNWLSYFSQGWLNHQPDYYYH